MINKNLSVILICFLMSMPLQSSMEFSAASTQQVTFPTQLSGTITAFTIAFWLYRPSSGDNALVGWADTTTKRASFYFNGGGGIVYWVLENGAGNFPTTAIPSPGVWHHIAMTFDAGTHKGYVDGVDQGIGGSPPSDYTVTGTFRVARDISNSVYGTQIVDDLRLYDRALSAAEVQSLAKSRNRMQLTTGLVNYWPMSEGLDGQVAGGSSNVLDRVNTDHGSPVNSPVYRASEAVGYP